MRNSKGQFLKGIYQGAGFKKGRHANKGTEFKKGSVPWNKGLDEKLQSNWSGNEVKYGGLHGWVVRHLGKPKRCEHCKTTSSKKFEWSNKYHRYDRRILSDWQRLCASCHFLYDRKILGTRKFFPSKEEV